MFDLIVENGMIIDGTGSPGFYGAVGIEGEKVRILRGDVSLVEAKERIDASGKVVCPGFIDMHAHSGLVMLEKPRHEPKVRQGVTTELIGIDGNSYAPFRSHEDFLRFVELNSGLDGDPTLPGKWSTVAEYLTMFDNKVAVNVAYVIGNSPLRIATTGWEDKPASGADLENMKAILREGMEEGAYGMSTGLDYPPGSYASTQELIDLSREAARLGGIYHTHVRNTLGDQYLDPLKEAIDIGRYSGIPSHITHLSQQKRHPGGAEQILALVEKSRDDGVDVTFDMFPSLFGSTRLTILFPQWTMDGGPERQKQVFASLEGRERLKEEMRPGAVSYDEMWLTYFKRPHNHRFEGKSIAETAALMGKDEVDAMCDLLLDEDLQVCYVMAGTNGMTLPKFINHPLSMIGSDGVLLGDYPSPRTYGTFPTVLEKFVREEGGMSLPEAVRKMTSFPAQRLGIPDRGLLRDGFKADLVVFDAGTVGSPATRSHPKQFPVGISHVLVNGRVVVAEGQHTGVLAGRALRRGRFET